MSERQLETQSHGIPKRLRRLALNGGGIPNQLVAPRHFAQ